MYFISCSFKWRLKDDLFMSYFDRAEHDTVFKSETQWEHKCEYFGERDRYFREIHSCLENCLTEGFDLKDGYENLDEAIAAYISQIKKLNPNEMFIDDMLAYEFEYSYLNKLTADAEFMEHYEREGTSALWREEFGCVHSVHLFKKDDGVEPYDERLGTYRGWGETLDIMVMATPYIPYDRRKKPEYHTVKCLNLETLTDAEREDVLLYCGVDAHRGPQEYHIYPGFVSPKLERVPLIYEIARDYAEFRGYKRPKEFVAIENLLRSYMKDYGLSIVDDDLYWYDDDDYEDVIDDPDAVNRFYLKHKVFFRLKSEISQEVLEDVDEDGYHWTTNQRQKIIPYEDGYAIEYITREALKEMEAPKGPAYTQYRYRHKPNR